MFEQLGALQMALRDEHRLMVVHYRLLEALDGMQGQYKPIATKAVRRRLLLWGSASLRRSPVLHSDGGEEEEEESQ